MAIITLPSLGDNDWYDYAQSLDTEARLIAGKANDADVVKLTGNQTIGGTKTFSLAPLVPDSSWTIAKTTGLQTALDAKYSAANPPPATDLSNYVTLSTTQTISGVKTFSTTPVVPDSSWTLAKISATGTRNTTTFLRGDGTFAVPAYPADAVTSVNTRTGAVTGLAEDNAVVHLAGTETISGSKTFSSPIIAASGLAGEAIRIGNDASIWDVDVANRIQVRGLANTAIGEIQLGLSGPVIGGTGSAVTVTGTLNTSSTLSENGARVYSASNTPPYPVTSVNGRTGSVVGLAEDNTVVHTSGNETIAGTKTFSSAPAVPDNSFTIAKISATGTRNTTTFLRGDGTFSTVDFSSYVTLGTPQTITGTKTFSSAPVVPTNSFPISAVVSLTSDLASKYSASNPVPIQYIFASGARNSSTFLRGDGTWDIPAPPAAMVTTNTTQTITGTKTFSSDITASSTSEITVMAYNSADGGYSTIRPGYMQIGAKTATASLTSNYSWLEFRPTYWNGTASVRPTVSIFVEPNDGSPYFATFHPLRITSNVATATGLIVKGFTAQTANILEIQSSSGGQQVVIKSTGRLDAYYGSEIYPATASTVGLVVQGNPAQSSSLQEWRNEGGGLLARVDAAGNFSAKDIAADRAGLYIPNPAFVGLAIQGAASQTGDLQRWQNSSGTTLAAINSAGKAVGAGFAKTIRIPHTFTVSGEVRVPSGDTDYIPGFFVSIPAGQTAYIHSWRNRINSGSSVTFSIRRNGTDMTTGQTATTTSGGNNPTAPGYALSDGDYVQIVVTAVSGTPKNLTVSMMLDYTV